MTPAERVVVEAARRFVALLPVYLPASATPEVVRLKYAVDALDAEQTPAEKELTWDQVAEGDSVQVGGKWFEVLETRPGSVRAKSPAGQVGTFRRTVPVLVRRGRSGQAVDVLGSVLWSGAS